MSQRLSRGRRACILLLALLCIAGLFGGCLRLPASPPETSAPTGLAEPTSPRAVDQTPTASTAPEEENTEAPADSTETPSPATPEPTPEPAPERRPLTREELAALTDSLDYAENGFFVTTYYRPEEIDWTQVFYCGAGIETEPTAEERAEYERYWGELMTDLFCVRPEDVAWFAGEKTGVDYRAARKPLDFSSGWYQADSGLLMLAHGDTNAQPITFTEGYVTGDEYELCYTRSDYENYIWERPFVLRARIRDGEWLYRSNLPADAVPPLTLLSIALVETREEAEALGVTAFYETEELPSDEPNWRWAVITAEEDDVRFTLDRFSPDGDIKEILSQSYGLRSPDENLTSGLLNKGETAALWVNLAWYPRLRLMATKEAWYGEYWFDDENWIHLEPDLPRYLTGHDYAGEGRGCDPQNETELVNFLTAAPWFLLDPESGEILGGVNFSDYRMMTLETEESYAQIYLTYDHLYTEEEEAPDLLCLSKYYPDEEYWDELPPYFSTSLGDYLVSAIQLDGEQLLTLSQANNGDGALSYLIPDSENRYTFTLIRYLGTEIFEAQG